MQTDRLAPLGEIFTTRGAIANGFGSRDLTDLVLTGQIVRVGKGVYRAGDRSTSLDPRAIARLMRVALSHESAAAWWGADLPFPLTTVHVTAPRSRGRRADCVAGVRLHRAELPPHDREQLRGALVTSPLRTLLDVARSTPLTVAVAIGDSMTRRGLLTPAEASAAAMALARGPGRRRAIDAACLLDPRAESVFESMTRVNLAIAGLPDPVPQLNILDADGRWIARVDFAWPDYRVILECDGFEFHQDRATFERDRRRWTALTRAGWRVAVVSWHDVIDNPGYLAETIGDLLRTAA
jgi:hypothetical protein